VEQSRDTPASAQKPTRIDESGDDPWRGIDNKCRVPGASAGLVETCFREEMKGCGCWGYYSDFIPAILAYSARGTARTCDECSPTVTSEFICMDAYGNDVGYSYFLCERIMCIQSTLAWTRAQAT
jgi:hypothetical protein